MRAKSIYRFASLKISIEISEDAYGMIFDPIIMSKLGYKSGKIGVLTGYAPIWFETGTDEGPPRRSNKESAGGFKAISEG